MPPGLRWERFWRTDMRPEALESLGVASWQESAYLA